jgi:hypothetical protein
MDLFFIFNMLNAICVSDDASAADASRRQKTRSNARVEYTVCFSMKNAPFSFLGLALTKDAITFARSMVTEPCQALVRSVLSL